MIFAAFFTVLWRRSFVIFPRTRISNYKTGTAKGRFAVPVCFVYGEKQFGKPEFESLCHPECSKGSAQMYGSRSFALLRMTPYFCTAPVGRLLAAAVAEGADALAGNVWGWHPRHPFRKAALHGAMPRDGRPQGSPLRQNTKVRCKGMSRMPSIQPLAPCIYGKRRQQAAALRGALRLRRRVDVGIDPYGLVR